MFRDNSGVFKNCRRICDELEVPNHGSSDYLIMREVCHIVSQRSAAIVAAGLSINYLFPIEISN